MLRSYRRKPRPRCWPRLALAEQISKAHKRQHGQHAYRHKRQLLRGRAIGLMVRFGVGVRAAGIV